MKKIFLFTFLLFSAAYGMQSEWECCSVWPGQHHASSENDYWPIRTSLNDECLAQTLCGLCLTPCCGIGCVILHDVLDRCRSVWDFEYHNSRIRQGGCQNTVRPVCRYGLCFCHALCCGVQCCQRKNRIMPINEGEGV